MGDIYYTVMGIVCVVAGVWCIVGAVLALPIFMNHRRAEWVVDVLGRGGARVFYTLLGAALIAVGVFVVIS